MAAVDAGYTFIVVDVGNYGSNSDTGIFKHSHFGQKFLLNELGLPPKNLSLASLRQDCNPIVSWGMEHSPICGPRETLP